MKEQSECSSVEWVASTELYGSTTEVDTRGEGYTQNSSFAFTPCFSYLFLGVGKIFRLLMQSCCFFLFFFSRPFHENFKFLKNCPYDFHEILHSHSTTKGAPACAKASKSYIWDVRNTAKITPKMAKKQPFFDFFSLFSKSVHTIRTKFSTVILHHIRVLYVQWHQNRMAGM